MKPSEIADQRKVLVVSDADRRRRPCDRTLLAVIKSPGTLGTEDLLGMFLEIFEQAAPILTIYCVQFAVQSTPMY